MDLLAISLLAVQAALAVFGVRQLVTRVYPALPTHPHPALLADVWTPIAVVMPLFFVAGRVGDSVRGPGWACIGAAACVGAIGLGGAAALTGAARSRGWRLPLACIGAGVLVLMLGAAHDLSMWIGQCTFAIGAVLLWMNTPTLAEAERPVESSSPVDGGAVMLPAVLAASVGQGVCSAMLSSGTAPVAISVGMIVAFGACAVVGAAAAGAEPIARGRWVARVAGWSAALGTFFGIGVLSIAHMLPQAVKVITGDRSVIESRVAFGFGRFAAEGAVMLGLAAVLVLPAGLPPVVRRAAGLVLAGVGATLAAWRVASM